MDETPHPSTLSEILDRTLQIYRRRFLVFVGLGAAPYAAVLLPACLFLIPFAVWPGSFGGAAEAGGVIAMILGVLMMAPVWFGVTALATGALTAAAAHCYFGDGITIRGAWKEAWTRGWRYTGLYLLETLLIWVAPSVVWFLLLMLGATAAAVARNSGMGASAGILVGLLAVAAIAGLAAYGVWMLLRLALAFPACVVERIGVGKALHRGPSLSRGTKGRIFLLYLLGWILSYLLSLAVTIPVGIAVALIPALQGPQHEHAAEVVMVIAVYGMAIAAQALTRPVYAIAMVLFYFDQRIRQEGFDIEWMMMRAGLVPPAPREPEPQPWMPPQPAEVPAAGDEAPPAESGLPLPAAAESAAAGESS